LFDLARDVQAPINQNFVADAFTHVTSPAFAIRKKKRADCTLQWYLIESHWNILFLYAAI
jgi:hypothetical protein